MTMKPIRITAHPALYPLPVQPGELVAVLLQCGDLFLAAEPIQAVASDHSSVTHAATSDHDVTVRVSAPAHGVELPVTLTLTGSAGTVRRVALLVQGRDPFTALVPGDPPARYPRWRGDWEPDTRYAPDDLATYGGLVYLALAGSTSRVPDLYPADWFAWPGTGGGPGGGPASHATSLRAVIDGDTYELTLGRDEFGGITTVITNLTGA